jgi:hypothetical protein
MSAQKLVSSSHPEVGRGVGPDRREIHWVRGCHAIEQAQELSAFAAAELLLVNKFSNGG